ncbi:SPOR domain-containing protein [Sphingomonas sp. Leaf357]|uniref:SPOR domain-containing protein n=1 Tax=Sphingomonas sp. Leaf357 TaxID=1736350 RepID=UPI0009E80382|nr:SPOR domain-containing protein [Sphingomonas sp. Leaf357]
MKTRALLALGLSSLAFAGTMTAIVGAGGSAYAGASDPTKMARKQFDSARKALAGDDALAAVKFGEAAVSYDPAVVAYRLILGQAYLKAGRFTSAHAAFSDALVLDPTNGKAALNLALAEIAEGNWDGARHTLDANAATIPVSDRGLAMALAGDPGGAVELLGPAVRAPDADAKTRQNFALSLALAGRWQDAKTVAAMDVAPGDLDARILQWAAFANPKSASDQVASLLGVTPVVDPGQPVALALNSNKTVAVAAAVPVDTFMPKAQPEATAVAAAMGTPVVAPAAEPVPVMASVSSVSFAPRREIVQLLPARAVNTVPAKRESAPGAAIANVFVAKSRTATSAFVVPKAKAAPVGAAVGSAKGGYFVQLGAFENAAVAKDAWGRASRVSHFGGRAPSGAQFAGKSGNFYRLSVGGFTREDADKTCRSYRAKGGHCFVRTGAGDSTPAWIKAPAAVKTVAVVKAPTAAKAPVAVKAAAPAKVAAKPVKK